MAMRRHGFTLVELAIVLGAVALLLAFALPSYQARLAAARRVDATHALERIHVAQERHRASHGLYAGDLAVLGSAPTSAEGFYRVSIELGPADTYTAVARARDDGPQAIDTPCDEITLHVAQGFATPGPSPRCWNR
jgi:prepilin-type N-terminal cleavage/methylation domain-containing protein